MSKKESEGTWPVFMQHYKSVCISVWPNSCYQGVIPEHYFVWFYVIISLQGTIKSSVGYRLWAVNWTLGSWFKYWLERKRNTCQSRCALNSAIQPVSWASCQIPTGTKIEINGFSARWPVNQLKPPPGTVLQCSFVVSLPSSVFPARCSSRRTSSERKRLLIRHLDCVVERQQFLSRISRSKTN